MKQVAAVAIFALLSCRSVTTPGESDLRRDASLREWNLRAGSGPDTLEYATGPLAVRNEVFCTTLAGVPVKRVLFTSLDGGWSDYRTSSKIEAFLASPRTCLILVEPSELWNEYPYLVLELTRTTQGWAPLTCGLLDQPDCDLGDRDPNEVRWFHPREGKIVVDGSDPDENAAIRISFRCRIPQDDEVGDIVLVANFEVAPKQLPEERPLIVQDFIEDAHVSERW